MTNKLDEIKARLDAATQGKWEWKGGVAPDWLPDTFSALDDLRVQIPTPGEDYDSKLWFVIEAMKSGFVMVRNADAELIASAPDYLRLLIPIVEAAVEVSKMTYCNEFGTQEASGDELSALTKTIAKLNE